MGLLDEREPDHWEKMQRFSFIDRFQMKVLTIRKKKTVNAVPRYNFPMFQNHMLSQQGMSGTFKVVVAMATLYLPCLAVYWFTSTRHTYVQE